MLLIAFLIFSHQAGMDKTLSQLSVPLGQLREEVLVSGPVLPFDWDLHVKFCYSSLLLYFGCCDLSPSDFLLIVSVADFSLKESPVICT